MGYGCYICGALAFVAQIQNVIQSSDLLHTVSNQAITSGFSVTRFASILVSTMSARSYARFVCFVDSLLFPLHVLLILYLPFNRSLLIRRNVDQRIIKKAQKGQSARIKMIDRIQV
jgi:hypothetical protein